MNLNIHVLAPSSPSSPSPLPPPPVSPPPPLRYAFDYAFGPDVSTETVFSNTAKFLVDGVLNGYDSTKRREEEKKRHPYCAMRAVYCALCIVHCVLCAVWCTARDTQRYTDPVKSLYATCYVLCMRCIRCIRCAVCVWCIWLWCMSYACFWDVLKY